MKNFKVGDRVRIREWKDMAKEFGEEGSGIGCICGFTSSMRHLCGQQATITEVQGNIVKLNNWSGDGDHSWSYSIDMIEQVDRQKIVITTEGKITECKLYDGDNCVDIAIARCAPEDEFDFMTGAKIAFDRLFEKHDTIEVGDTVKVVNHGCQYTTYAEWFDKNCPHLASRFAYSQSLSERCRWNKNTAWDVVHIAKHGLGHTICCAITPHGYKDAAIFLMGIDGLEKV